jgi:hypothetical protein
MASEVWLLGHPSPIGDNRTLPTGLDVLRAIFYHEKVENKGFSVACLSISETLEHKWADCNLTCMKAKSIQRKVCGFLAKYKVLRKSQNKNSSSFNEKKQIFGENLKTMFDISMESTVKDIKYKKLLRFFMDQKTNRYFTADDYNLNRNTSEVIPMNDVYEIVTEQMQDPDQSANFEQNIENEPNEVTLGGKTSILSQNLVIMLLYYN